MKSLSRLSISTMGQRPTMLPFANEQIDAGQLSAGLEFLPC
jgi:hypothetical protein